jgi:hypothetical protein
MSTRSRRLAAELTLTVLASSASAAAAGREPVLKQIKVPHSYYYREMYLPQATSGPNAVAWCPDGLEVAVSMQGSLWRIDLAAGVARQITNGPGYDYQPDWSPDGRTIAYASYDGNAVELRLLDLASGATSALTANGAVNVEPRWSPDGRRIAFVSTEYKERWHIHVLDVENGVPGRLVRLTEDNDSRLPRYYYSVYDHFLSPTWSPDGSEILFVSNRGHVWGSGGFWRMKAEPGAPAREIRYEETTWRARPDWSRDGKRVVYSSYLGRPWNQLWLMTSEGGDPFPITYGDFDSTGPRWSPDGRRIAYISNEDGNTALWVQEIPGGARRRIEIRERTPLGPVGTLEVEVVDAATGAPIPARVSITTPDGRSHVPDDAWRHADDSFDRAERKMEYGYFHSAGAASVRVPAGPVAIEVARGLEYRVARREVVVGEGAPHTERFALERLDDLPARGWWSGDVHVHMNYGGAYRNTPANLVFQATAEDVHVVESLIVNKEQRVPDIAYFSGSLDPDSTRETLLFHGQEFHTSYWGHTGILGPTRNVLVPGYAAYVDTAAASLYPHNAAVSDRAHAQGALFGYVHPFDEYPDPARADVPLTHELPVDVALGKVDYYEVIGFSDHLASTRVWYRLLNCGFRLPAAAGTDAMANFASLRGPVGLNRVFVKADGPLDHGRWLAGLKAGRSFATNGPLLSFTLGGKEAGDEISLPPGRHELEARVEMRSIVPVDHLDVVSGGQVRASIPLTGDRTSAAATLRLKVDRSGWYTLRAYADGSRHPVLDIYPFATTSPIYVTVGKAPLRSKTDAAYFLAWIDRLESAAQAHAGWNTEGEKAAVLASLAEARAVYRDRAAATRPR